MKNLSDSFSDCHTIEFRKWSLFQCFFLKRGTHNSELDMWLIKFYLRLIFKRKCLTNRLKDLLSSQIFV